MEVTAHPSTLPGSEILSSPPTGNQLPSSVKFTILRDLNETLSLLSHPLISQEASLTLSRGKAPIIYGFQYFSRAALNHTYNEISDHILSGLVSIFLKDCAGRDCFCLGCPCIPRTWHGDIIVYTRGSITTCGGHGRQWEGFYLGEGQTNALVFGAYMGRHKVEAGAEYWPALPTPQPPKPLKAESTETFVLLTGGEATTSSLITSPQTRGSLINPSERVIYGFWLRSLMRWPSSTEAETPWVAGWWQSSLSLLAGARGPGETWTKTRTAHLPYRQNGKVWEYLVLQGKWALTCTAERGRGVHGCAVRQRKCLSSSAWEPDGVEIPTLALGSRVSLDKSLSPSVPQFCHLWSRYDNSITSLVIMRTGKLMYEHFLLELKHLKSSSPSPHPKPGLLWKLRGKGAQCLLVCVLGSP